MCRLGDGHRVSVVTVGFTRTADGGGVYDLAAAREREVTVERGGRSMSRLRAPARTDIAGFPLGSTAI